MLNGGGGIVSQSLTNLRANDFEGLPGFSFLQGFANAINGFQVVVDGSQNLTIDRFIGFSIQLPSLTVAENDERNV